MDEDNRKPEQEQDLDKEMLTKAGQMGNKAIVEPAKRAAEQQAKKMAAKIGARIAAIAAKLIATLLATLSAIMPYLLIIIFFITVFIPVSDYYLNTYISQSTSQAVGDIIGEYCYIDDTGIHFNKSNIMDGLRELLKNGGIDYDSLGLGQDNYSLSSEEIDTDAFENSQAAQYLYNFMTATLSSGLPYIEGSDKETQGIIKIKRKSSANEDAKDLKYIGYEKLKEMTEKKDITDADMEEALKYFSLDQSWNLWVIKPYKQIESYVKKVNGGIAEQTGKKDYELILVEIPYRTLVSQYSVPFEFLIDLQIITQNANYVQAVADLTTKDSQIDLTIFDSITNTNYTYTKTYEQHSKGVNHIKGDPDSSKPENRQDRDVPWSKVEKIEEVTTINTTEDSPIIANVTKAKTWLIDQVTEYISEEKQDEITVDIKEGPYSDGTPGDNVESATWIIDRNEHTLETVTSTTWQKAADSVTKLDPRAFMGLWKNKYGYYVQGEPYDPKGSEVPYFLPGGELPDRPIINILTDEEEFYGLLEEDMKTQTLGEIMRELIRIYKSGEELDVDGYTSLFSQTLLGLFDPTEFVEGSYSDDFDIHDESFFIKDVETLKQAFRDGYSGSSELVKYADKFLEFQNKYKVNALFAAAVSITETSGGRAGNAINGKNNWFNLSIPRTNLYQSFSRAEIGIEKFFWQISQGGYYYTEGNYTVATIGAVYCPATTDHPYQDVKWIEDTLAQISRFYSSAGINADGFMSAGSGGVASAEDGIRKIHPTFNNRHYVEYLQYLGPWKRSPYDSGSMKSSGCLVASVAVVLSGFGIDKNPEDIRRISNGALIAPEPIFKSYGFRYERVNKPSQEKVLYHLRNGNPVIILSESKVWTNKTGHFFPVLEAVGNQVYVANVGSATKTGWMDISEVMKGNKQVIFISK